MAPLSSHQAVELWELLRHWWGEIALFLSAAAALIWRWRGPIQTAIKRLAGANVNGKVSPAPSIAPVVDPQVLIRLEEATRVAERERAEDRLLDRFEQAVEAARSKNAEILHSSLAEIRQLLDVARVAYIEDVRQLRVEIAGVRKERLRSKELNDSLEGVRDDLREMLERWRPAERR